MANQFAQFLLNNPMVAIALFFGVVMLAVITRRLVLGLAFIVLLALGMVLPGGIALVVGGVAVLLVYILAKARGIHVTINGNNNTVIIDQSQEQK